VRLLVFVLRLELDMYYVSIVLRFARFSIDSSCIVLCMWCLWCVGEWVVLSVQSVCFGCIKGVLAAQHRPVPPYRARCGARCTPPRPGRTINQGGGRVRTNWPQLRRPCRRTATHPDHARD